MAPRSAVLRSLAAGLMAAAGLGVVGCGTSTTVVTDRAPAASASTATSATASSRPASTTTSTASPSTATPGSGLPRCTAADLSVSFLGQQGATGHGELGFALRNTSSRTCHTFGYPGIEFLAGTGAALPTSPQRVTRDFFGVAPVVGIDLAPGERASFRLGVTHFTASGAGCVTAAAVQVIAPDDTHTLRVTVPDGAYECGTVTVSPLRPGTSAFV